MRTMLTFILLLNVSFNLVNMNAEEACLLECFHAGQCKFHSLSGQNYCDCPSLENNDSGFQGVRCEEPYIKCSDSNSRSWRCLNGGTCDYSNLACKCPEEFEGTFCNAYTGPCDKGNGDFLMGDECMPSWQQSSSKGLSTSLTVVLSTIFSLFGAALCFYAGKLVERKSTAKMAAITTPRVNAEDISDRELKTIT